MVLEDLAIFFGAWLPGKPWFPAVRFREPQLESLPGFYNGISTAEVDTLAAETCATAKINLNFYIPTPQKS